MKTKNRFSKLLGYLMEVAELKNYTLANELQYDVSYISKWINGRMLPGTKTEKSVLQGISRCVVRHGSAAGLEKLFDEYLVTTERDLESAICDHLTAEYDYVRNSQQDSESAIAPKTLFFPKLDLRQYIERMRHPVLRRVKSLDIMAMMDLMSMDREFRLQITQIDNRAVESNSRYPDVHFSMVIGLDAVQENCVYDVVFLLNMLTVMTHVDFKLYGARHAFGRTIFTVRDEFSISGMLTDGRTTMSVVVSEDAATTNTMYQFLENLCTRERLLVRQCSMSELIRSDSFARGLIAPNQRMVFGHMTEHFLPDAIFEQFLAEHGQESWNDQFRWIQALSKRRFREMSMRILIRDTALSDFAARGELEVYNTRIRLTPSQRLQYIQELYDLVQNYNNLSVKMIYGRLFSDFHYRADQSLFLNDGASYLTLGGKADSRLYVVNNSHMKNVFGQFFDEVWENYGDTVISDRDTILQYLDHIILQIRMIARLEAD